MNKKISDKQIAGLTKASQQKQHEALIKAQQAIDFLLQEKQKITIRSVARKAGVSVSYIYKYPELAYKIQRLKEQQKYNLTKLELSSDEEVIEKLKQEKAQLIQAMQQLKSCLTDTQIAKSSTQNLQLENIRLQTENQQLRQELEYTRRSLQETREFILSQGYNNPAKSPLKTRTKIVQQVAEDNTNVT